ncbi:DinB: DNA-directed DNA polymerase IV [Desulfosarcina variabilis str. Montpellier]|uniref:DNA polymerase IV n=1 Tax=Desulfosarcina variabilis TaxID=2300 RepID=UPI003AFA6B95
MILHIDMDAFFASVEQRDNPDLKGNPLVVGGASGRGVVAAASYEARRYGIHSAMPMFMAKQRCSHLTIVPPRKDHYAAVSRSIMAILSNYSPVVEQVSIDEAYLDAAGCERLFGPARTMASTIKSEITRQTRLTCSIGVAPLKFLAKIASDMQKPDGLTVIHPAEVADTIKTLPLEKVPGVGKTAYGQLKAMGLRSLGDIQVINPELLKARLGKFGGRLVDLAHGKDDTRVTPHTPTKSISTERTLPADTLNREDLQKHLLAQSQEVGRQLRRDGFLARTITLKMKDHDFKLMTRSITLARPTQSSEMIYQTATALLGHHRLDKALRLIGVGASSLIADTPPQQGCLFTSPDRKADGWEKVDHAIDRIAERFGRTAVHRGSLTPTD